MRVAGPLLLREGPNGTEARCCGCGKWKVRCDGPESEFGQAGRRADGTRYLRRRCKACVAVRARRWHEGRYPLWARSRQPADPYRAWLLAYRTAAGLPSNQALADALGVERRRNVSAVLNCDYERVSLSVVDRAVMNASLVVYVPSLGRAVATLDDLYPLEEAA